MLPLNQKYQKLPSLLIAAGKQLEKEMLISTVCLPVSLITGFQIKNLLGFFLTDTKLPDEIYRQLHIIHASETPVIKVMRIDNNKIKNGKKTYM